LVKVTAPLALSTLSLHDALPISRIAWGFGRDENLSADQLIREKYRGIRPAAGYPASPDHTEKRTLFGLLDAEKQTGITLTESFEIGRATRLNSSHVEISYAVFCL